MPKSQDKTTRKYNMKKKKTNNAIMCKLQEVKGTQIFTKKRSYLDETLTYPDACCKNNIWKKKNACVWT